MRSDRWLACALPALLVTSVLAGEAPHSPPVDRSVLDQLDFSQAKGHYVFLLNIDALNERTFHELLDAGELPNIARMLKEKHGQVGRLLSAFPSSTAPAIPEVFHGRFLDRSETLPRKVHAFDRETRQAMRYTFKDRKWVDDQIDVWDIAAYGHIPTYTCFLRRYDGMERYVFRQKYLAWDSFFEFLKMPRVMNFDMRNLKDTARFLRTTPEIPQLSYIWCDTLDVTGHIHGPYSEVYRRGLREIDRGYGWLFDAMRSRRLPEGDTLYDRASFLVFGDHGLTPSEHKIDVDAFLKKQGMKVRDTSHITQFFSEYMGKDWASRVDAVFVPGGSTVAEIYLRSPRRLQPWTRRLSLFELEHFKTPRTPDGIDVVRSLAALPGMDMVLAREDDGTVRLVTSDRGEAHVLMRHTAGEGSMEEYAYVPIGKGDPLGYGTDPAASSLVSDPGAASPRWVTAREWLVATLYTAHPFAVVRIPHAFGHHATESDIITVAVRGYDFLAHSKGDHGGLDPETMITPLCVAGAALPADARPPLLTTVDMLPTMLHLLGIRPSEDFEACLDGSAFGEGPPGDSAPALAGSEPAGAASLGTR